MCPSTPFKDMPSMTQFFHPSFTSEMFPQQHDVLGTKALTHGPLGDIADPNPMHFTVETARLKYNKAKRKLKLGEVKIFGHFYFQ